MMYFFTRRAFFKKENRYTDNVSTPMRYIAFDETTSPRFALNELDADVWAKEVLKQSPSGEVLIYVHGFNTSQADLIMRLITLRKRLKFKGAIIGFDWPTPTSSGIFDLKRTYIRAKKNANKLGNSIVTEGLNVLWAEEIKTPIHVFGHSMGAYVTALGFALAPDSAGPMGKKWSIKQAIFGAADVEERVLKKGAWAAMTLDRRSERCTHYYSNEDKVLQMSEQIYGGVLRSGRDGISPDISKRFFDVSTHDRYLKQTPKTKQTTQRSHSWYLDEPGFLSDLDAVLRGDQAKHMATREAGLDRDQRLKP